MYFNLHVPRIHENIPSVLENGRGKLVWEISMNTYVQMSAPDLVLYGKELSRIVIIYISYPWNSRVDSAFEKKISKY